MFSLAIGVDFNESCAEKKVPSKRLLLKKLQQKKVVLRRRRKNNFVRGYYILRGGIFREKFHLSLLLYGCYMALIAQPYGKCHRHMTGPTVLPLHYLFH